MLKSMIKKNWKNPIIKFLLFQKWSHKLAKLEKKPRKEMISNLNHLYNIYQTKNFNNWVDVFHPIHSSPGFPFINSVDFIKHVHFILEYLDKASQKELPKVALIAQRKTASSYISVVLCRLFDVEPTMLSFKDNGIPAWINSFAKWGGITHEHYYPSQDNFKLLKNAGLNKFVVHFRHPVSVSISEAFHWLKNDSDIDLKKLTEHELISLVRNYLDNKLEDHLLSQNRWLLAWREKRLSGEMEILETRYEDMITNQKSFFERILDFFNVPYDSQLLETILKELHPENKDNIHKYNFRKGSSTEWSQILTSKHIQVAKKIIGKEFDELQIGY